MVNLGDWISEGFNMLKEQFWAWVLVALVYVLVSMISWTCVGFIFVAGIIVFGPHAVALAQIRGGRVQSGDMFSAFNLILPGLGFIGIMFLIAIPSMLLLGIPMIFIMPIFTFVPHLVADRKMGLIAAMRESSRIVKQDYWMFLLMNFIVGFIAGLGANLCYVGMLVTLPFYYTVLAVAYRDCFRIEGACSFRTEDLQRRDMGQAPGPR